MHTVRCSGRLLGGCLPGRPAQGVSAFCLVYTCPPSPWTDRHLWKHNLSPTTVADGENKLVIVSKWIPLIFSFQDTRSSEDKVKEIIDSLCHISESTTWKGFFSTLSDCGNQQVADKVRGDIAATAMAEQIEEGSTCKSSL